jgi:hypothetical protein
MHQDVAFILNPRCSSAAFSLPSQAPCDSTYARIPAFIVCFHLMYFCCACFMLYAPSHPPGLTNAHRPWKGPVPVLSPPRARFFDILPECSMLPLWTVPFSRITLIAALGS